jgi:MFS family permease
MKRFSQREAKGVIIAIFNSFSWYFPLYIFFANELDNLHMERSALYSIYSVHYVAIIAFAVAGSYLATKIERRKLLSAWMLIGTIGSMSMLAMKNSGIEWIYIVSFALGLSLGLGFPSCLAYFADLSMVETRGSMGGFIYFLTAMGMFAIGFSTTMLDFVTTVLLFAIWRGSGLVLFLLARPRQQQKTGTSETSGETIFGRRAFILYFIPWTMFCLINFLEIPFFDQPLQQHFLGTNLRYLISIGEFGIGGLSALAGGFLSDIFGRKRILVSAYIMVGIGYAVLSLSFSSIETLYLYILLDGIAWGVFALMFYFIIWGDLAGNQFREKYYLVGILPFLISSFISILFTPYAGAIPLSTAFSLASFFLFLAILPLIYAPETMPERKLKERELRNYLEKAKKTKEKYA